MRIGSTDEINQWLAKRKGYFSQVSTAGKKLSFLRRTTGGVGSADIQSKGVNAGNKAWPKSAVNGAVAVDARHGGKGGGTDGHVEMRLTAVAPTAMAAVAFTIIDNFKPCWGERGGQL